MGLRYDSKENSLHPCPHTHDPSGRALLSSGVIGSSLEKDFTEDYLTGRDAVAAYNPESSDVIYLIEHGDFIKFQLIESRFSGKGFAEVKQMQDAQKSIVDKAIILGSSVNISSLGVTSIRLHPSCFLPHSKILFGYGFTCAERKQWDSDRMPSVIVSDMGSEYKSSTFSQITELGVTLINLPALRPELKSIVERSFQLLDCQHRPPNQVPCTIHQIDVTDGRIHHPCSYIGGKFLDTIPKQ